MTETFDDILFSGATLPFKKGKFKTKSTWSPNKQTRPAKTHNKSFDKEIRATYTGGPTDVMTSEEWDKVFAEGRKKIEDDEGITAQRERKAAREREQAKAKAEATRLKEQRAKEASEKAKQKAKEDEQKALENKSLDSYVRGNLIRAAKRYVQSSPMEWKGRLVGVKSVVPGEIALPDQTSSVTQTYTHGENKKKTVNRRHPARWLRYLSQDQYGSLPFNEEGDSEPLQDFMDRAVQQDSVDLGTQALLDRQKENEELYSTTREEALLKDATSMIRDFKFGDGRPDDGTREFDSKSILIMIRELRKLKKPYDAVLRNKEMFSTRERVGATLQSFVIRENIIELDRLRRVALRRENKVDDTSERKANVARDKANGKIRRDMQRMVNADPSGREKNRKALRYLLEGPGMSLGDFVRRNKIMRSKITGDTTWDRARSIMKAMEDEQMQIKKGRMLDFLRSRLGSLLNKNKEQTEDVSEDFDTTDGPDMESE